MSRRFKAIGAVVVTVATGIAVLVACRPERGTSGVHVEIDLDQGWSDDDAFDHILVTATYGETRLVGCFDTRHAYAPDAGGPDPCGDDPNAAWLLPPTVKDWALGDAPRTINFEIPAGTNVTVTASAGLGGWRDVGVAYAGITAAIGEPTASLHLSRKGYPPGACLALLSLPLPDAGADGGFGFCDESPSTCVEIKPVLGPSARTAGVGCRDGSAFLAYGPGDDLCPGAGSNVTISRTIFGVVSSCLQGTFTGHFYRCKEHPGLPGDGPCTPTTDCDVPRTDLVIRTGTPANENVELTPLSCIPPTAFPITFAKRFHLGPGASDLTRVGFMMPPDAGARACFLQVEGKDSVPLHGGCP